MVENVFALAVALHIERYRTLQGAVVGLGQQVLRLPAGAAADRLRILERLQEGMAEERAAGGARREGAGVPLLGVHGGKRVDDAQADGRAVIGHDRSIARNVLTMGPRLTQSHHAGKRKVRQLRHAGRQVRLSIPANGHVYWLSCTNF